MDGYEELREEFAALGVSIFAGTVDSAQETLQVSEPLGFPVCHSLTRAEGDLLGAWWDRRRDHIQPTEFILTSQGTVLASTYSNSPLGRMDPSEALTLIQFIRSQQ